MPKYLIAFFILINSIYAFSRASITRSSGGLGSPGLMRGFDVLRNEGSLPPFESSLHSSMTDVVASAMPAKKKTIGELGWRWITGVSLGGLCTLWIASPNLIFTSIFVLPLLLAQQEYYNLVAATNTKPTRKTSMVFSILSYFGALYFPQFHEMVVPMGAIYSMLVLLLSKQHSPSINEIATSFFGLLYLGYLPSFWIRLKASSMMSATGTTALAAKLGGIKWLGANAWTVGAIATWFTWTSIVAADVGAFFFGKAFGKTKLADISAAAGAASPNKSVEGFYGGMLCCMGVAVWGANAMGWPMPVMTGAAYGVVLSIISLVGDLTASMMKRDAKMKDSGNILPGHGGLLDRIDSYMFTAPVAYIYITLLLPLIRANLLVA